MDMQFTMQEIAQMLGEKDLLFVTLTKQLNTLQIEVTDLRKRNSELETKVLEFPRRINEEKQVG